MSSSELVSSFVGSLQNVLTTMTGIEAIESAAAQDDRAPMQAHVAGIIGIAGDRVRGSLIISFSKPCFLAIASQMLGEPITVVDNDIADMAGEIVNMTMGGAKLILSEMGFHFELSLPSTAWGESVAVRHNSELASTLVGLKTSQGPLTLELCLSEDSPH